MIAIKKKRRDHKRCIFVQRMMRSLYFFLILVVVFLHTDNTFGQAFLGFYSADNTINLVPENPAFALNKDRVEVNLFGVGTEVGGNSLLFKHDIFSYFTNGMVLPGKDYIKNPNNDNRALWMNMEILGPGAAFKIKKRYAVAITTGLRYFVNSNNLDNKVFNHLGVNIPTDSIQKDNFNLSNYYYTAQMFKEINFSYADYLISGNGFTLVGGASLKLLMGVGALAVGIPQLNYNTKANDTAYNLSGNANIAYTPYANRWALTNSPFNAFQNTTNNLGLGLDLGVVLTINYNPNPILPRLSSYQVRLAASITDIGNINYDASSISGSYTINNKNINYKNIQNNPQVAIGNNIFNNYITERVLKSSGKMSTFKMGLPTAFRFNADLNIIPDRFLVNTNVILNLRSPSANNFDNHYISTFTITPRYMYKQSFGWAVPFSYNAANQGSLGAVALVGSFYLGCSSFFNTLISNNFNNINIYTGVTLRIKPFKAKEKDIMMMY